MRNWVGVVPCDSVDARGNAFWCSFAFREKSDEWLELAEGIFSFCSRFTWTPLGMLLLTIGRQCDTRVGRYHQEQH